MKKDLPIELQDCTITITEYSDDKPFLQKVYNTRHSVYNGIEGLYKETLYCFSKNGEKIFCNDNSYITGSSISNAVTEAINGYPKYTVLLEEDGCPPVLISEVI